RNARVLCSAQNDKQKERQRQELRLPADGRFTSHPLQTARWMGHPFCCGRAKEEQGQQQVPFGDDNRRQNKNDSKGFLCTLWAGPFAEDELLRASFYLGMRVKL